MTGVCAFETFERRLESTLSGHSRAAIANGTVGRIGDGPLCAGETKSRTFVWWLDLAGNGLAALE
jgi:hypothetical protein